MKIAPHFVVGLTSAAALSAGAILAAEDRALFEPQEATLMVAAGDGRPAALAADARSELAGRRVAPVAHRSKH